MIVPDNLLHIQNIKNALLKVHFIKRSIINFNCSNIDLKLSHMTLFHFTQQGTLTAHTIKPNIVC